MHPRILAIPLILGFAVHSLACSPDTSSECIDVDEQLGDPSDRRWCGGEFVPPDWDNQPADHIRSVCFEPGPDGACKLCPRDEVIEEVEAKMREDVSQESFQCEIQHWELGCMRTVESAKMLGRDTDYCCFQVAVWGPGCKY